MKPPPGATKLHYADALSCEFTLLLRERRFVSLEDMMDDATEVEVNLSASHRNKQRHETKRVKDEEPQTSTSSSSLDVKHDTMMKALCCHLGHRGSLLTSSAPKETISTYLRT